MKKLFISALICAATVSLFSCGGQKKKVEAFADTFAGYVNSNQLDSIKSVYPEINFDSISHVSIDSISITEAGGNIYKVNYGGQKWIEVKVNEDGSLRVENSKGIAAFPESKYEMALNSGMVSDTVPDVRVRELLNDEAYFDWLRMNLLQPIGLTKGKIRKQFGVSFQGLPCECATERMTCTVVNNTKQPISGNDYDITYAYSYWTCSDGSSPDGHTTGKKKGVDLAPGESADINIAISDYGLKNVQVKYNVPLEKLYDGLNPFTGNEYQEYLKEQKDKSNMNYDWLSTREVTAQDLQNKSPEELRIMRNWIYARHGYIFKSPDLTEFFSKYSWYEPTSKNVTSELNKTELSNIQLIQGYE